jgi:aspartate carbamoyltransferase catalytic subunit
MPTATDAAAFLDRKDLLGLEDFSAEELTLILDTAVGFEDIFRRTVKKVPTLQGKTVVNLFYENSTRTRTSFELAAKRLSADVINFDVQTSSVQKGESLADTVETIQALGADFIVMRHPMPGAPHYVSKRVRASVLNAGDGAHEHPTQALLDAFTIRKAKGQLAGLRVAIVGDILHSRVARSNIHALQRLGVQVRLVGPPTLVPDLFEEFGCEIEHDLRRGLRDVDVVYLLRIQLERQAKIHFPSLKEYQTLYGLNAERLGYAKPGAIVMHPGPVNRGVEVSAEVLDGPHSLVCEQVTSGVAIRMAVLYLLHGGATREATARS